LKFKFEREQLIKKLEQEKLDALTRLKEEHEEVMERTIEEERSGHLSANQAAALASAEAFKAASEVANNELKKHFKDRELKYEEKIHSLENSLSNLKESSMKYKTNYELLEQKLSDLSAAKMILENENEKLKDEMQKLFTDDQGLAVKVRMCFTSHSLKQYSRSHLTSTFSPL